LREMLVSQILSSVRNTAAANPYDRKNVLDIVLTPRFNSPRTAAVNAHLSLGVQANKRNRDRLCCDNAWCRLNEGPGVAYRLSRAAQIIVVAPLGFVAPRYHLEYGRHPRLIAARGPVW